MPDISVERIEIKIGKKILSLTPVEMKELRDILDATFPKKEILYIPSEPIMIEKYPAWPRPWKHWEPYWCSNKTVDGVQHTTMRIECKTQQKPEYVS